MSHKIHKILVPVDFSESSDMVINNAVSIASALKSMLTLIHVVEYRGDYFSVIPEPQSVSPMVKEIEEVVERKMNDLQDKIHIRSGIMPKIIITPGNVVTEIRNAAKKENADMIVMGTHGASGYQEIFLGSNAQRVVTLSEIPVLTMKNNIDEIAFKNLLLPFDDSLHSRQKVNIAFEIAEKFGSTLHFLGFPNSKEKQEVDHLKVKLKNVEDIAKERNLAFTTEIVHDDHIAKAAMEYATKNGCDLIVINTGHESRITGVFLGAFAQQIVNHATIPVLSIKPSEESYTISSPGFGVA